jgi:hypothetical protein
MIARPVLVAAGMVMLLAGTGCNREAARRKEHEEQRAARLEQALAKLQADHSSQSEEWARLEADLEAALAGSQLPERQSYRDSLAACRTFFTSSMEKVTSRDVPGIVAPALAGWRAADALQAKAFGNASLAIDRAGQLLRQSDGNALQRSAATYEVANRHLGIVQVAKGYGVLFHELLRLITQDGPRPEREAAFDRLAGEHRSWSRESAQSAAWVLQAAWAAEDEPVLKAHMGQKLTELGLPLTPPPADTTARR